MSTRTSISEMSRFLDTLDIGVEPTLHVNGHQFHSAIAVVDLGTPLKPIKLTTDEGQEMVTRLRKLTKELLGNRDVNVRINQDYQNGIYWSSIG